jgi:hypothetical protein
MGAGSWAQSIAKKKGKKKVVISYKKEGCNTRTSQRVTQASTTLAQARLTAEFWWDPVH